MAARIPDITEFQITQRFWDGVNVNFRLRWTDAGYTPEYTPLSKLEKAAEHFEDAENLLAYELRKTNRNVNEPTVGLIHNYNATQPLKTDIKGTQNVRRPTFRRGRQPFSRGGRITMSS